MMIRAIPSVFLVLVAAACRAAPLPVDISAAIWPTDRLPARVSLEGSLTVQAAGKTFTATRLTCAVSGGSLRLQPGGLSCTRASIRIPSSSTVSSEQDVCQAVRGELTLTARGSHILAVLTLPLEDYVARVTSREMPSDWPADALAAQAVVARSFAAASIGRHARDGFDVCPLTHCQLWSRTPPTAAAMNATKRTAGFVLQTAGRPLEASFSSTCGGRTAAGESVGLSPALTSVPDGSAGKEYCRASPHFYWETRLSKDDLKKAIGVDVSKLDEHGVEKNADGRVVRVVLGRQRMDGMDFMVRCGRELGWNRVKSTRFLIRFDTRAEASGWMLQGKGLGHGAGLCQWGARGRALKGQSWQEILRAYFPQAELVRR